MAYERTPEWWKSVAPDGTGRENRELGPQELADTHGEVTPEGWGWRRRRDLRQMADKVVFPVVSTGRPSGAARRAERAYSAGEVPPRLPGARRIRRRQAARRPVSRVRQAVAQGVHRHAAVPSDALRVSLRLR